ncbi:MAG TPA: LysM peptidoglycan-binding domain-containing protein [Gammaproteobacteria bacterium]
MLRAVCCAAVLAVTLAGTAHGDTTDFPRPASLEPAVRFWTRVYTEIDTEEGFIHDDRRLDIVYKTIGVPKSLSAAERRRRIEHGIRTYRTILTKLGSSARNNLSDEERRVLSLFGDHPSNAELKAAASRVRFQLGQADRFRAGLVRSGEWKPYILSVLEKRGLPSELAALPHVESSFDPTAYSKVGAAGMWQFTRSTGLRYMRIDHVVDERRDPFFSTDAAARLLADNYALLQSWPLALTAYNHGAAGMRRAVSELNTKDIGVIVAKYRSRSFGFASRNFYAAFLAALDVETNAEKYFGPLKLHPPADSVVVEIPDYVTADTLARALHLPLAQLRKLNPALTETVWAGDKFVPKGFALRVPRDTGANVASLLAAIPATERYAAQRPDVQHRVRRGDTLSEIAAEYGVSLAALMRLNNLRRSDLIRVGQVLTLPVAGDAVPPTLAARAESAPPALEDGTYVVQRGDSVVRIAARFGVDAEQLLAANRIADPDRIYAGQTLRIPGADVAEPVLAMAPASPSAEREGAIVEEPAVAVDVAATRGDEPVLAPLPAAPAQEEPVVASLTEPPAAPLPNEVLDAIETNVETDGESDLEANVLASVQADLAADPSDYSVAPDGTIEVQALETLGHYADWLEIRTQSLRDLNGLPFHRAVVIGQRLKLDFSKVDVERFEQRRLAYHRQQQEAFFSAYHVEDVVNHVVKSGESLWLLAQHRYRVPLWLLRQYNPDLELDEVLPGTVVKFPKLQRNAGA